MTEMNKEQVMHEAGLAAYGVSKTWNLCISRDDKDIRIVITNRNDGSTFNITTDDTTWHRMLLNSQSRAAVMLL